MANAIDVNRLNKKLDTFTLNNISFTVPQGAIVGLVGENGAGKTTTIKLLMDVMKKDSGDVTFFSDQEVNSTDLKEDIAIVYDDINFYDKLNAVKIDKIMRNIYKTWDSLIFFKLLEKFHLPKDREIKQLSKGMKMKLNIIIGLAHSPKLLILDEPTSGLDPAARLEMLDLFLDFVQKEDHAILFSSHITSDLEKIADYIVMIHDGHVVLQMNKDDLLYGYGIARCSKQQFELIPKGLIFAYLQNEAIYHVIINDAHGFKEAYPEIVVDKVALDELLAIYIRGEKTTA